MCIRDSIDIYEVDGYQRKYDGIHPTHDAEYGRILRFLPEPPGYLLTDVDVKNEG